MYIGSILGERQGVKIGEKLRRKKLGKKLGKKIDEKNWGKNWKKLMPNRCCIQFFGGLGAPAGLAVKGIRTNSSKPKTPIS
jgi:hypothetical protein